MIQNFFRGFYFRVLAHLMMKYIPGIIAVKASPGLFIGEYSHNPRFFKASNWGQGAALFLIRGRSRFPGA
jgi:hypothetical protein